MVDLSEPKSSIQAKNEETYFKTTFIILSWHRIQLVYKIKQKPKQPIQQNCKITLSFLPFTNLWFQRIYTMIKLVTKNENFTRN